MHLSSRCRLARESRAAPRGGQHAARPSDAREAKERPCGRPSTAPARPPSCAPISWPCRSHRSTRSAGGCRRGWSRVDRALGGRLARGRSTRGDFRGKRGETPAALRARGAAGPAGPAARPRRRGGARRPGAARSRGGGAVGRLPRARRGPVALVAPALRRVRTAGARAGARRGRRARRLPLRPLPERGRRAEDAASRASRSRSSAAPTCAPPASPRPPAPCSPSPRTSRGDLSNEPPNALPPRALAQAAERDRRRGGARLPRARPRRDARSARWVRCSRSASGSANPPRVIVLEHGAPKRGARGGRRRPPICLVGKGVTFDSGGLSIKPTDEHGADEARHVGRRGRRSVRCAPARCCDVPLHVVGIVGAVENMPSGTAYRPDDILTSMSGKTIEVGNTDAEGRLVLADVLHLARTEYQPGGDHRHRDADRRLLRRARALGRGRAREPGADRRRDPPRGRRGGRALLAAAALARAQGAHGSQIADVRQVAGRDGGTIVGGAFLWHFAGDDVPWAHLDIAADRGYGRAGAYRPTARRPSACADRVLRRWPDRVVELRPRAVRLDSRWSRRRLRRAAKLLGSPDFSVRRTATKEKP